jgi:hypothetical protein
MGNHPKNNKKIWQEPEIKDLKLLGGPADYYVENEFNFIPS